MKKLLPHFVTVIFTLFALGVAAATLFYSFNGLGLIFPNDLLGQGFGMLLFDIAMFIWFMTFISKCESTMQYVFSMIGFLVGLAGTIGLVSIEVGISSGLFVAAEMTKPLTYIFIGVMIGHLILLYAHHSAAPNVSASISLGVEKAKIVDKAGSDAESILTKNIAGLSAPLANKLVQEVMRDLGLTQTHADVLDLPALDVARVAADDEPVKGNKPLQFITDWILNAGKGARKYEAVAPAVKVQALKPEKKSVFDNLNPWAFGDDPSGPTSGDAMVQKDAAARVDELRNDRLDDMKQAQAKADAAIAAYADAHKEMQNIDERMKQDRARHEKDYPFLFEDLMPDAPEDKPDQGGEFRKE